MPGAPIGMRVALAHLEMSAALMTLFAVSIVGALGMAVYGLRVLVGRWEKPRRPKVLLSVQQHAPVNQLQPQPQPIPTAAPQVWVHPTTAAPVPMAPLIGVATPPPLRLPVAGFAPPPPSYSGYPGYPMAGPGGPELSPRLARGSIPPDYAPEMELELEPEPDTDPGVPEMAEPEPRVQRGARFSVIRSSRR